MSLVKFRHRLILREHLMTPSSEPSRLDLMRSVRVLLIGPPELACIRLTPPVMSGGRRVVIPTPL